MAKTPIPIRLPEDLLDRIDAEVKEHPEGTRSAVIRNALRSYFQGKKPAAAEQPPAPIPNIPSPTTQKRPPTKTRPATSKPAVWSPKKR